MCRLLACPPGFSRNEALEILNEMEGRNEDGFGYTYLNPNGEFVTRKYGTSFSKLLKRNNVSLLAHMPHDTWTIIHERAASHGAICKENSHPFETENYAICHNGMFKEHGIIRLALSNTVNFEGDTDSEVAAHLIDSIGPRRFALSEEIDWAGVYLCLKRDGSLEVVKSSGDLVLHVQDDKKVVISSELDRVKYKFLEANRGWYRFDKHGEYLDHKKRPWSYKPRVHSYSQAAYFHNQGNFHHMGLEE